MVDATRRVACLHRDDDRAREEITNEPFNISPHRRGEEERMTFLLHLPENGAHVVDESHVEHAIRLIENDRAEAGEVKRAALHKVLKSSGGADDECRIVLQL